MAWRGLVLFGICVKLNYQVSLLSLGGGGWGKSKLKLNPAWVSLAKSELIWVYHKHFLKHGYFQKQFELLFYFCFGLIAASRCRTVNHLRLAFFFGISSNNIQWDNAVAEHF